MTHIDDSELRSAVAARFYAVNGTHPMTPEDDIYVNKWYVPLEALAEQTGIHASELRRLMLANRLPLPSYIRSDGTQMVARDQAGMRFENGTGISGDTLYVCVTSCLKQCNAKTSL